jgi:hypothetical protein
MERMGELQLRQDLDGLVRMLNDDEHLDDAVVRQDELLTELAQILELLMTDEEDRSLEERMKELEEALKALDGLIEEEKEHQTDSTAAVRQQAQMSADPEAAAAIQALIKQQDELLQATEARRTGESEEPAAQLAERQKALAKMADELGQMLESKGEPAAAKATRSGSDFMKEAGQELDKEQVGVATDAQSEAVAELQRALDQLGKKPAEGSEPPDLEKMAEGQDETTEKTADLAEKMAGDPEDPESEPIPGQEHVGHAQKQMGQASRQLRQSSAGDASRSQDRAVKELQQARNQVQKALQDLKREQQEKKLEELRLRLAEMLTRQQAVTQATLELAAVPAESWQRPEELRVARQAEAERELAVSAEECLKLVTEDGTTAVLPYLLERTRDDLRTVGDWLAAREVGPRTQHQQEDIERTLEDLLEIIEQTQNDSNSGEGQPNQNQQDQQQPDPPLLPTSAELQLLARLQQRVFDLTQAQDRRPEPRLADIAERLAAEQRRIAEMTAQLNAKLQQMQR